MLVEDHSCRHTSLCSMLEAWQAELAELEQQLSEAQQQCLEVEEAERTRQVGRANASDEGSGGRCPAPVFERTDIKDLKPLKHSTNAAICSEYGVVLCEFLLNTLATKVM